MAYEKRNGDFVLFKNENRKTDKHPHATGELLLNGVTYELAAWAKPDRNGKTFWAGNAKVKGQRPVGRTQRDGDFDKPDADLKKPGVDFDDKIPF